MSNDTIKLRFLRRMVGPVFGRDAEGRPASSVRPGDVLEVERGRAERLIEQGKAERADGSAKDGDEWRAFEPDS